MTTKLDASHRCVLENWESVTQMKDCAAQVDRYLKEFASKVCGAFHAKHQGKFDCEDKVEKSGYFQLHPISLTKWKKTEWALLSLGIEYPRVESILHIDSERPFLAYVFSQYRAFNTVNDSSTDQLISIVPPPPDFGTTLDNPERGCLFQKVIPAITPADFCDPKKLEKHLVDPLAELVAWFTTNEETILKAFSVGGQEKIPH